MRIYIHKFISKMHNSRTQRPESVCVVYALRSKNTWQFTCQQLHNNLCEKTTITVTCTRRIRFSSGSVILNLRAWMSSNTTQRGRNSLSRSCTKNTNWHTWQIPSRSGLLAERLESVGQFEQNWQRRRFPE